MVLAKLLLGMSMLVPPVTVCWDRETSNGIDGVEFVVYTRRPRDFECWSERKRGPCLNGDTPERCCEELRMPTPRGTVSWIQIQACNSQGCGPWREDVCLR